MKTTSTQQEILLMTGTKFAAREWADKIVKDKNKLSATESLETPAGMACWMKCFWSLLKNHRRKKTCPVAYTILQVIFRHRT